MFTLTFRTDTAAFDDSTAAECARILRVVAEQIDGRVRRARLSRTDGTIRDANSNSVGGWAMADHRTAD